MADIQFNADAALAKLGELVAKHGPQAVDVAAQVVQINALGQLIVTCVGLACAAGLGFATYKIAKTWWARQCEYRTQYQAWKSDGRGMVSYPDEPFGHCMAALSSAGLTAFVGVPSVLALANVWMWVGLFSPKLALANAILTKVGF